MIIKKATAADLDRCLEIYKNAREYMRQNGNPDQWGTEYPYEHLIVEDIEIGRLYVVDCDGSVEGVFLMESGPDDTYLEIEGEWLNDEPYYVIHRIASSGRVKGVVKAAVDFALKNTKNVRIDQLNFQMILLAPEAIVNAMDAIKADQNISIGTVTGADNVPKTTGKPAEITFGS